MDLVFHPNKHPSKSSLKKHRSGYQTWPGPYGSAFFLLSLAQTGPNSTEIQISYVQTGRSLVIMVNDDRCEVLSGVD